jgi:2-keto-3-deoxy-L-rhamnonate aldolase RhmA
MNLEQVVSKEVVAGVFIGALCLSAILFLLYKTEDNAVALMVNDSFSGVYQSGDIR